MSTHGELQRTKALPSKTKLQSLSNRKLLLAWRLLWFASSQDGFITWLDKRLSLRQQGNQTAYFSASIFTKATTITFRNGTSALHIFLLTRTRPCVGNIKRNSRWCKEGYIHYERESQCCLKKMARQPNHKAVSGVEYKKNLLEACVASNIYTYLYIFSKQHLVVP